jgi:hypothetical protein
MRKALTLFISLAFVFASFSMIAMPALAQTEDATETIDEWDWDDWDTDWDTDWDDDWWNETDTSVTYDGSEELAAILGGGAAIFGGVMLVVSLLLGFGMYIFTSLALMTIAKRLNYENGWFAWIPILNIVLMLKMGDMNPWLVLLMLIPGLGGLAIGIIAIIALMNICEKRGYDKLLGLLSIIPIANLVLIAMLAWGKKKEATQAEVA